MWTFGWSWTHLCCYADHGVGWGGDVNVRLQLNTPRMLRWSWGGVEMWTFGWSWTRLCCYADHGVGWGGDVNVRLQLNTPRILCWSWGGVEMWTFGWSWTRLCCYADHGVGWGGVGMLTFVSMPRSINTFDPGNGVGKTLCVLTSWKKPQRSTCTMINESGKAKKVRNLCCKGCKIQETWPFLGTFFSWTEGHETLKGLSFLSACWCAYTRDSAPGGMFILWVKRFRCRPLNMLSFRVKSLHHALWRSGLGLGVMRLFKSINDMMDNNMDGCVISCFDVIYI